MITVPGTITTPTAGPLLCPQMVVHLHSGEPGVVWTVPIDGLVRVAFEAGIYKYTARSLVVPLDRALNLDACTRWLARHLGNWQPWEVSRAMQGDYATLAAIYRQLGLPDPGRWEPHPDPAEALRLACLAAAGVTP